LLLLHKFCFNLIWRWFVVVWQVPPGMSEEQRRMQIKLQQQRAAQRAALGASAAAVTPTNSAANPSSSASVSASALDPIQATIMCGLDPTTNMGACGNYSNAQALMTKANLTTESVGGSSAVEVLPLCVVECVVPCGCLCSLVLTWPRFDYKKC
jgi:hypothetical protein